MDHTLDVGVDRALAAVAERALRCGAHAGMETLLREALRLTGASGAALFDGRTCLARMGTGVATPLAGSGGRRPLKVWPEKTGRTEEAVLERLAAFGSTLVAAHARESAAAARQARLLASNRSLEREANRWETKRSLAAHDLRTPLMVIKGYLDMMMKGTAGPLSATMQRYLDRMMRAGQDQRSLIEHRLGRGSTTDLGPLLRTAFGSSASRASWMDVTLTLPNGPLMVKSGRDALDAWVHALARGLASTRAGALHLQVEAAEPSGFWRLQVEARDGGAPTPKSVALLQELTRRLAGTLRLPAPGEGPWVAHLPADLGPPGASAPG